MVGTPGRVAIAAVIGSVVLTGGARGTASTADRPLTAGIAHGPTGPVCSGGGVQGFAISFVHNFAGSASPVAAARYFVRHNVGGFGTPSSVWTVVRTAAEPGAVTVTDGTAFLHTIRLENGRWAVDSGEQCS